MDHVSFWLFPLFGSQLASPKIAIAEKSLRFQMETLQSQGFAPEIAETSPENRRKIESDFSGRGVKNSSISAFSEIAVRTVIT